MNSCAPVPLFDRVDDVGLTGFARIDFSRSGDAVYRQRLNEAVHWIEACGVTTPLRPDAGDFEAPALSHEDERHPRVSPDGRWLAYMSRESGRFEVYVRSIPDNGRRWPVSTNGGSGPQWSPDGRTHFMVFSSRPIRRCGPSG